MDKHTSVLGDSLETFRENRNEYFFIRSRNAGQQRCRKELVSNYLPNAVAADAGKEMTEKVVGTSQITWDTIVSQMRTGSRTA